jgi:pimeloyl-[acyl-carrier protein] methyl ester esterase
MMKIILQHGWGCDSRMWSGLIDGLQKQFPGSTVAAAERGYFGLPASPPASLCQAKSESNNEPLLLICHSFGLHMVSPSILKQCHGLVLISSFSTFHVGTDKEQKLSRTRLRRMLAKIQIQPVVVVQDFLEVCGFTEKDAMPADVPLLAADLQLLDQCNLDLGLLQTIPRLQILHGGQDMIVPVQVAHYLNRLLPNAFLAVLESAQHSLPMAEPDWCLEQITSRFAPAPARVWKSL